MLLRIYSDVTLAANDGSAYALYLQTHRKLIVAAILLTCSYIHLTAEYI